MSRLACAGVLLVLLLALGASANAQPQPLQNAHPDARGPSASAAADRAGGPRRPAAPPSLRRTADFRMSVARSVVLAAGAVVFAWGLWLPRDPRSVGRRVRLGLLLLVAALAYASYYQFFRLVHVDGFATTDNYHYYVGSKYFPELGYFGLYECSLVALGDRGFAVTAGGPAKARDLRSMQERPLRVVIEQGQSCRERFSEERWRSFQDDVYHFVHRWPPHIVRATWRDHGYHPSPIWTLIGGSVASSTSMDDRSAVYLLSRLDRVIVLLGFVMVAWAFGLEMACLAAIVWGTGFMWRYTWVGDAFLRHLWWITAVGGVCLLRRGWHAGAGASLATSALLRIFPAAFSLGYLLHAARDAWQQGRVGVDPRRFVLGAGVATVVLVSLSVATSEHGLTSFLQFAVKIRDFAAVPATNRVGLAVLARWAFPETAWAAAGLRLVLLAPFLFLFWRALRESEAWEASVLGVCLVPMLTEPTNYYYSFMPICALLAARRPYVGVIVLLAAIAWCLNGLIFYRQYDEFRWASLIAVAACFAIVAGMTRGAAPEPDATSTPGIARTA